MGQGGPYRRKKGWNKLQPNPTPRLSGRKYNDMLVIIMNTEQSLYFRPGWYVKMARATRLPKASPARHGDSPARLENEGTSATDDKGRKPGALHTNQRERLAAKPAAVGRCQLTCAINSRLFVEETASYNQQKGSEESCKKGGARLLPRPEPLFPTRVGLPQVIRHHFLHSCILGVILDILWAFQGQSTIPLAWFFVQSSR